MNRPLPLLAAALLASAVFTKAAEPRGFSGIYPQLAMYNEEGECGTGAVVPWAGRLWVVAYAPHQPHVQNVYRKLEVHSRGEAVYEALQLGLVKLNE